MTDADIQWAIEWSSGRLTEEEAISNIIRYWKFKMEHGREPEGIVHWLSLNKIARHPRVDGLEG